MRDGGMQVSQLIVMGAPPSLARKRLGSPGEDPDRPPFLTDTTRHHTGAGGNQRRHPLQGDAVPGSRQRHALHTMLGAAGGAPWRQGKLQGLVAGVLNGRLGRRMPSWLISCQRVSAPTPGRLPLHAPSAARAPHPPPASCYPTQPPAARCLCHTQQVDEGLVPLEGFPGETSTRGLGTLAASCKEYAAAGARFAKWRAALKVGGACPTEQCIEANASQLAEYAVICQVGRLQAGGAGWMR